MNNKTGTLADWRLSESCRDGDCGRAKSAAGRA